MDLTQVMRTTFAARQFTDDAIDDEVVHRILEHARFAPSGGNRQGWHVIVVRDRKLRDLLGHLIVPTMKKYRAQVKTGESPFNTVIPSRVSQAHIERQEIEPEYVKQFTDAPVLLLILVDLRVVASMDSELERIGVISGASIYPFVWNILLAARNEGLGGTLTTFLAAAEPQVKEIFHVPDHYAVSALLPIGKPIKQLTKLSRNAVHTFTTMDSFQGPSFVATESER